MVFYLCNGLKTDLYILIPLWFGFFSISSLHKISLFVSDLQWFPFAPRMTWNLFNMGYKALNYLTPKYLSVLPPTKFPLTLIVSYNDLLYQSGCDRLSYYNKQPPNLGILKVQRLICSVLNVYQQWWGRRCIDWEKKAWQMTYWLLRSPSSNDTQVYTRIPLAGANRVSIPTIREVRKLNPSIFPG